MVVVAVAQPDPADWSEPHRLPAIRADELAAVAAPVAPRPDSLAVLVVPDRVDPQQVNQVLAGFETVVLTHDARTAAAALAALAHPEHAPNSDAVPGARSPVNAGELVVDPDHHEATWQGRSVTLTGHERAMLHCLLRPPRSVWSYQRLHEQVWRGDYLGDPAMVHSAVKRLRNKLSLAGVPHKIVTVRGIGFRVDDPVS